jgi:anaerobic magnesium-protoporphyrin IX monomethyl ester cyclase
MRIALVNAPLQSLISDLALGHQTPIGLLMVAGPIVDDGHKAALFDTAREHWSDEKVVNRLRRFQPHVVMMGHSASTKAHPSCLRLMRAIKSAMPHVLAVYGGVHPTFQCEEILGRHLEVDLIIRGEGEVTALELTKRLALADSSSLDLSSVAGIAWRDGNRVVVNPSRPPVDDLDGCRIAWELIEDWDKYQAFGLGRTAVVQFSRGCPHRCSYCGQWPFWVRWRHRDVTRFVDELESLYREHGVRFFWFADENPTTDQQTWKALLEEIARRDLHVNMTASIRARDIVRDAGFLDLYRQAGFLYVLMGVETASDDVLQKVGKDSMVNDAYQAVRLLREHRILSIIDYIFGFEPETWQTIWRAYQGLQHYDSDFVNSLYLTPYPWTPTGREMRDQPFLENDFEKWDYRHQVVPNDGLSATGLHIAMKMVECLYHLHPKRFGRMLFGGDRRLRRQVRFAYRNVVGVFLRENYEFARDTMTGAHSQPVTPEAYPPQPETTTSGSN